jgi:peroxiredoxin Q/BCP
LGVSSDTRASHQRFAEKYALEFPLIADTDGAWARAFGVKATMGLYQRVTFLVAPNGRIAKVYDDVDPGLHAVEVLEDAARF